MQVFYRWDGLWWEAFDRNATKIGEGVFGYTARGPEPEFVGQVERVYYGWMQ